MFKIIFSIISLGICFSSAYEYDFLKGFELCNPLIQREGSFYRLHTALEKDFQIADILSDSRLLEDFTLESVFRFNTESSLFHLITIGDKYSGQYITFSLKNTDDIPSIRVTLKDNNTAKVSYTTNSKRLIDGRWHKLLISFSKGTIHAWLDCEYMENRFDSLNFLSSINFANKEIQHVIIAAEEQSTQNVFDIQKLKLYSGPTELIHVYCHDIPGSNLISRYNPKELDFLKIFKFGNTLTSGDGNFHRFNGPFQHHIKLPEVFVSEKVNNITFECLFRFNGSQEEDIALLEIRDQIYDHSIKFIIGNYESMALAENNYRTHNDMFVRVALSHKKIFDGKWHKIVFAYSKKFIQFWVDCHLVRTNPSWFMSPVFFNGVSQNLTLLSTASGKPFRDFDIMALKLRTDYSENLHNICDDVPLHKFATY